jgi:hypothetical protein
LTSWEGEKNHIPPRFQHKEMAYLEEMAGGNNLFMETPSIHPNKDEAPGQSSKDKIPTSECFLPWNLEL